MNQFSLRPLRAKDMPGMLEWMQDPAVNRYFQFSLDVATAEYAAYFIENSTADNTTLHLAIVNTEDEYMGTVSLKKIDNVNLTAEYAIALRMCAQRHGAGRFATTEILRIAFEEYKLDRVYLNVLTSNQAAVSFYEKMGFCYEGEFRKHLVLRGKKESLKWFSMLRPSCHNEILDSRKNEKQIEGVWAITFAAHGDGRGSLVAMEGQKEAPFDIKRIFYVYGCDGEVVRGQHANRVSEFVMICIHGSVRVRAHDGKCESEFLLDSPGIGLYLGAMTWKEMYDFTPDAVLLVLSSAVYDPDEYIRDFDEFVKEAASHE